MNQTSATPDRGGTACMAYATLAYLAFLITIACCIAFLGNLFGARTIDAAAAVPVRQALAVNVGLLCLFGLQHSGMARKSFKAWFCRRFDPRVERSTYVLASSIATLLLIVFWQPMGGVVWSVGDPVIFNLVYIVYFAGWILMFYASCLIDHFELFGLRQAWTKAADQQPRTSKFETPGLYRRVRHPVYLGWLLVIWAAPVMTVTHLLFAAGMTIYMLVGIQFEERDLVDELPDYRQYRRKVPMLLPSWYRHLEQTFEEHEKQCQQRESHT